MRRCSQLWFLPFLLLAQVYAQDIRFELGFNQEIVANHWNPLVLELRNHPPVTLRVAIDQGSLKEGEIPMTYEARLPRSQGFSHFEDELFLPEWRSISWVVESEERILASGSFPRRQAETTPLALILSNNLASWADLLPDHRLTEALSHQLPERVAAYDGVEILIMDGTVTAPSPEAIISAATAGTRVIFFEPLPSSYASLLKLTESSSRLGAGYLLKVDRTSLKSALLAKQSLDREALLAAFDDEALTDFPRLTRVGPVLVLASLFSAAILLIFRFLPSTAVTTSIVLSLIASILAWSWLKPYPPVKEQARTLEIAGGDLALEQGLYSIITLPSASKALPFASRIDPLLEHRQAPNLTLLELSRWSNLIALKKPRLVQAKFQLIPSDDGLILRNLSAQTLQAVYVKGRGLQSSLAPDSQLFVKDGGLELPPGALERIAPFLPNGTALAIAGDTIFVSLPEMSP
ncbi:MAG: hypothetical protein KC422_01135 [Trueperaceae bacterium]|nr:hypothetical protein [Trueperaceae bacterium]